MDEHQESRAKEVNFIGLIFFWLEKWRWIVISMLILAVLAGGYKYHTVVNVKQFENQEEKDQESQEFYEGLIEKRKLNLAQQEEYLSSSVVMQIDSHQVSLGILRYHMECGRAYKGSLLAAYDAYISGGELSKQLYMSDTDISVEDLRYLVSFIESSYSNDVDMAGVLSSDADLEDIESSSVIFQIQVRMPDSSQAEKYLNLIENLLMEYSSQLQAQVSEHEITLLFSGQTEMTDQALQRYQSDVWSTYMNSVSELERLQANVNSSADEEIVETEEPISSAVKYAMLGLVTGVFFSCFILMLQYLFGDRLQNIQDFKAEFGMPLLGVIKISGTEKKLFGFIDTWLFQMREKSLTKMSKEEQIRMAAVNMWSVISNCFREGELKKVMFAGTVPENEINTLYLGLISEMREVVCSPYMQIVYQSSALKELDNYDAVLFLEKQGVSQCSLIMREKGLASDRGVKILGTIVVC